VGFIAYFIKKFENCVFFGRRRKIKEKDKEKKLGYNLKNCTLEASSRSKYSKSGIGFSKLHQEES